MKQIRRIFIHPFLKWIIILFSLQSLRQYSLIVHASTDVTKYNLPYEITDMRIENQSLIITGWAYIAYQQHYLDQSTHSTQFYFYSDLDTFIVDAQLLNFSQTLMMEYFGSPNCSLTSINKYPESCNFAYENVGFIINIPLDRFKSGHHYQSKIISNAFIANVSYQTDVYFPLSTDLVLENSAKRLTIISRLDDTNLTINSTTVLARKEPSKTANTWFYGTNCSSSYLNQLYFLKNTVYKNVYEKRIVDNTSFYRLKANLYLCNLYRRRIIEGQMFDPVWIASPYVSYSGTPLSIYVETINQAPKLSVRHIEIFENETIDLFVHVSAYDYEDGDISDKIELIESNYQQHIGNYQATFRVVDSVGLTDQKILTITVKEIPNFLPEITAQSIKILQYGNFRPLEHVSAYDIEDGDITDKIQTLNTINTTILGEQQQCYSVTDSNEATVNKCMTVNVISYKEYSNYFRFVSVNYPFENESIPRLWKDIEFNLFDIINRKDMLDSIILE